MLTTAPNPIAELATKLLIHYSFDLNGYSASELISLWQKTYPINWLHLAVVEALYQGRYKAISVEQILVFWLRREQPIYHFNMEFERMVCSKFPERLSVLSLPVLPLASSELYAEQSHLLPTRTDHNQIGQAERGMKISPPLRITPEPPTPPLALAISQKSLPPSTMSQMLLASANHPPIGQFTPQPSDRRSESFTSKLKAMTVT